MFGNRGSAGAAFALLAVVMVSVAPSAVADTAPGGQARRMGLLTGAGSLTGSRSGDPAAIDWRSNTLAFSHDRNPAEGMVFDGFVTDRPGHAKELLPSLKQDGIEMTTIPTGGINVEDRDYLAYMSVRHFGQPGHLQDSQRIARHTLDNRESTRHHQGRTTPPGSPHRLRAAATPRFGQASRQHHRTALRDMAARVTRRHG